MAGQAGLDACRSRRQLGMTIHLRIIVAGSTDRPVWQDRLKILNESRMDACWQGQDVGAFQMASLTGCQVTWKFDAAEVGDQPPTTVDHQGLRGFTATMDFVDQNREVDRYRRHCSRRAIFPVCSHRIMAQYAVFHILTDQAVGRQVFMAGIAFCLLDHLAPVYGLLPSRLA